MQRCGALDTLTMERVVFARLCGETVPGEADRSEATRLFLIVDRSLDTRSNRINVDACG
jgi:hypothetical protein